MKKKKKKKKTDIWLITAKFMDIFAYPKQSSTLILCSCEKSTTKKKPLEKVNRRAILFLLKLKMYCLLFEDRLIIEADEFVQTCTVKRKQTVENAWDIWSHIIIAIIDLVLTNKTKLKTNAYRNFQCC